MSDAPVSGSSAARVRAAVEALADLAPEADGVRERYERLGMRVARDPILAASRAFRLALAAEVLDLAERLLREASGESDEVA
jgi:hypothetical protein